MRLREASLQLTTIMTKNVITRGTMDSGLVLRCEAEP